MKLIYHKAGETYYNLNSYMLFKVDLFNNKISLYLYYDRTNPTILSYSDGFESLDDAEQYFNYFINSDDRILEV